MVFVTVFVLASRPCQAPWSLPHPTCNLPSIMRLSLTPTSRLKCHMVGLWALSPHRPLQICTSPVLGWFQKGTCRENGAWVLTSRLQMATVLMMAFQRSLFSPVHYSWLLYWWHHSLRPWHPDGNAWCGRHRLQCCYSYPLDLLLLAFGDEMAG